MLLLTDIVELLEMASPKFAVQIVPGKMRFEWPSLMLFNNKQCKVLTPEFVETAPNLFDMTWAGSLGALPPEWNHCVGYDAPRADAKLAHFTQGVPLYPETEHSEFASEWRAALEAAVDSESWETLMGQSVHKPKVVGIR